MKQVNVVQWRSEARASENNTLDEFKGSSGGSIEHTFDSKFHFFIGNFGYI